MVFSPVEKTLFVRPHRDSAYVWDHFSIFLSVEPNLSKQPVKLV